MDRKEERKMKRCACGCGRFAKEGKRFIKGHFWKGKQGSWAGKKNPEQSKRTKGKNNPMYGKKNPEQSKRTKGKNNPMYGKRGKDAPMFGRKNKWGHHTKEARLKISESHKGKNHPMWGKHQSKEWRKKISKAILGKKRSEETKRKMSEANKGENCYFWCGGISFEPYGEEFNKKLKKQIRERDKFICQECKQTEKKLGYTLICHHIDYNKKNNDPDNLISLCKSCHPQTNFSREDWTKYFQKKIRR